MSDKEEFQEKVLAAVAGAQAEMRAMREQFRSIGDKIDVLVERSLITQESTKSAHKRIDDVQVDLTKVANDIKQDVQPVLQDYKETKSKAIGATFAFGTISGAVVAWLTGLFNGGQH